MLVQDRANDPYHMIAVLWSRKCQLESSRRSIYCVQIDLVLVSGVKLPPEVFLRNYEHDGQSFRRQDAPRSRSR